MSTPPIDIRVPSFGQGLDEALLVEWLVAIGDRIGRGDVIALVETDKASVEIVAERGGRIAAQPVAAGAIIRAGDVMYQLIADIS